MKVYDIFKRILDIVISVVFLLIFWLPMLIVAIVIKCDSKGSAFFTQRRLGKDRKEFILYKFRSMTTTAPADMPTHELQHADAYITKVGKFIRRTSIDELPQFLNILKGDMSLIGPRPALYNQIDLADERDKYNANSVRPGLTGWAQINGRDDVDIPVKAKMDGEYVKKRSLLFDLKIIFGSFGAIISGRNITEGMRNDNKNDKKQ
ncbi:MAG: sugar transferase [Clostridia bacterium]|nr:sugar transferase [Clostridia bacterium]MBQ8165088.1 sugar transferase [Clostridia bacterium]